MSILYNQYQLSNSTRIPEYQGSVIPELTKVVEDRQNKWDIGKQQSDLLEELLKNSSAHTADQTELNRLKKEATDKLKGYATGNDYENTYRKVALDARDFVGKYKHIAANKQAVSTYQAELEKSLEKGDIKDPATIRKAMAASLYGYKGLQMDPETGQYRNQFSGMNLAKEIDIPKKLDDWMSNYGPQVLGSTVRKQQGGYYVESGGETRKLGPAEIAKVINAAKKLDKEYSAYITQERVLNTIGYEDMTPEQFEAAKEKMSPGQSSIMQQSIDEYIKKGHSFGDALKQTAGDMHESGINSNIQDYASKFQVNDRESSYKVMGETEATSREAEANAANAGNFALTFSTTAPGGGLAVKSASDFNGHLKSATQTYNEAMNAYSAFLKDGTKGPITKEGGRVFQTVNGVKTDITDEANRHRANIAAAQRDKDNFEAIKTAAERESGMDKLPQSIKDQAQKAYDAAYAITKVPNPATGRPVFLTENERKVEAERAERAVIERRPEFAAYEAAIKRRLNNDAVSSTIITIGDKKIQDLWSQNISNMADELGINGILPLSKGGGQGQGNQLTAGEYKDLRGKDNLQVVGFEKDVDGNTVLKIRALADVKGKKTKGEDFLVNLAGTNADEYLQRTMAPAQFEAFQNVGMIKASLSKTGRNTFDLTNDGDKGPQAKVEKDGNVWKVTTTGKDNTASTQIASSYEGIYNIIQAQINEIATQKK